jgi:hypothetical protein
MVYSGKGSELVTIIVGQEKEQFAVHESLLTHSSAFFRAALSGQFKEASERCVTLDGEDPVVFEFFVYWLYYSTFPTSIRDQDEELIEEWSEEQRSRPRADIFIHLYIMSDRYSVTGLGSAAADAAFRRLKWERSALPRPDTVHEAFNCLPHESGICRLIIEVYAYRSESSTFFDDPAYHDCSPFVLGLVRRLTEMSKSMSDEDAFYLCHELHEHVTTEEVSVCEGRDQRIRYPD